MVAPSLSGYVILDDADNNTDGVYFSSGTVGGTSVGAPNVYNAPYSASHASLSTSGTGNAVFPNYWGKRFSHTSHNITGRFLTITLAWTQHLTDVKANGGLVVAVVSASGGNRSWQLSGYQGVGQPAAGGVTWEDPNTNIQPQGSGLVKWRTFVINPSRTDGATTVATFALTNITSVEIRTSFRAAGGMQIPINKIVSVSALTVINGEVGNPATIPALVSLARTVLQAWLAFDLQNTQYFFIVPVSIGNGSTLLIFNDSDKSITFAEPDPSTQDPYTYVVNNNDLGFTINSSASDVVSISRFQISSTAKWHYYAIGSTSADCTWTGGSLTNFGTNQFSGSVDYQGVTFARGDRINPGTGIQFLNCTVFDSTTTTAFLWDGTQVITGTRFTDNTGALEIAGPGDYYLDRNTFLRNTYDIYVTDSNPLNLVRIIVDANSTTDIVGGFSSSFFSAGAQVEFVLPEATITFNVTFRSSTPPSTYEWWLYEDDPTTGIIGTVELAGAENETLTTLSFTHSLGGTQTVFQLIADGFVEVNEPITLSSSSQEINIFVDIDTYL